MSLILEELEQRAETVPDRVAFLWRTPKTIRQKTYKEVYEDISGVCCRYQDLRKRRVGILGGNSYQWIIMAWAMMSLEATAALLDPVLNEEDLRNAILRTDLEILVCDQESKELGMQLQRGLPGLELCIFSEDALPLGGSGAWNPSADNDFIFFTSGTTKNSKAAVSPASAIEENALCLLPLFRCRKEDLVYIPLPYHHAFGFSMLLMFFYAGCPIMLGSVRNVLREIRNSNPQILVTVPNLLSWLLEKQALSSAFLKNIMIAGGVCTKELAGQVLELGISIQNHYGSSEFSGGIAINLPEDPVDALTPHAKASVFVQEDGEILVQSPFLMKEYYGMPEETRAVLKENRFKTGDMGSVDEQGRLHLAGRKKDTLILDSGEKIFCPDVDAALSALEGISEGAVLSCDNVLVAVLSPKPGTTAQEIDRALEQYNNSQPFHRRMKKLWVYPGKLPYTSTGKLQRRILEEEYRKIQQED